jgi:hypothetical protein
MHCGPPCSKKFYAEYHTLRFCQAWTGANETTEKNPVRLLRTKFMLFILIWKAEKSSYRRY